MGRLLAKDAPFHSINAGRQYLGTIAGFSATPVDGVNVHRRAWSRELACEKRTRSSRSVVVRFGSGRLISQD